jgi:hypothetical protein
MPTAASNAAVVPASHPAGTIAAETNDISMNKPFRKKNAASTGFDFDAQPQSSIDFPARNRVARIAVIMLT